MSKSEKHIKLAKTLINKLRDENFSYYLESTEKAAKLSQEEYDNIEKNPDYDKELQKIDDERFYFLSSLDTKQKETLNKLILHIIDSTAFNFLREIEENHHFKNSIGLTINNTNLEDVYNEFLSGTFFGEYMLWIDEYSNYDGFQH